MTLLGACTSSNPTIELPDDGIQATLDPTLLVAGNLVSDVIEVDCTLSGGTDTTCYQISMSGVPTDHDAGPWCPRHIADGADVSGIWLENGQVYDADGTFIANLSEFYGDDGWQLFDETTGDIYVTDTEEAFDGAARPNVEDQYQNHCVEGSFSYLDSTAVTFVIPKQPIPAMGDATTPRDGFGFALNGTKLDAPAPADAILAAYTIAAFDDCGGHLNPVSGYHYHAVTSDCLTEVDHHDDHHAPLIGYALDGFPIFARLDAHGDEPVDLDTCGGHFDEERGYHYHVGEAGGNQILGCLQGEYGCALYGDDQNQVCDAQGGFFGR